MGVYLLEIESKFAMLCIYWSSGGKAVMWLRALGDACPFSMTANARKSPSQSSKKMLWIV